MPELWGHCDPCGRWFFAPFAPGAELAEACCPVCTQAAGRFEIRLDHSAFPVEVVADTAALS